MKNIVALLVICLLAGWAEAGSGRTGGSQSRAPKNIFSKPSKQASGAWRSKKIKCPSCPRDSKGRILRGQSAKKRFMRQTGYPKGRKGYIVTRTVPTSQGGLDDPSNMQWQAKAQAKAKAKMERKMRK
jgi:hypothetical protein